jgi:hypothetical protein
VADSQELNQQINKIKGTEPSINPATSGSDSGEVPTGSAP